MVEILTKEKFKELREELLGLQTQGRKQITDSLVYAKSLGDLSENAEYAQAREDQAKLEDRISKIEHILKTAKLATKQNVHSLSWVVKRQILHLEKFHSTLQSVRRS